MISLRRTTRDTLTRNAALGSVHSNVRTRAMFVTCSTQPHNKVPSPSSSSVVSVDNPHAIGNQKFGISADKTKHHKYRLYSPFITR